MDLKGIIEMADAKTVADKVAKEQARIVTTLEMAIETLSEAVVMVRTGETSEIRGAALLWKDSANSLGTLYKRVRGSEGFGQK